MTNDSTNKRVMISGASGLIGRSVVEVLANRGWRIDALVRSPGKFHSPSVVEHVIPDLASLDPATLYPIIVNASCILHLAAIVPGKEKTSSPDATVKMARVIAEAASHSPNVRMIHVSSAYASLAEQSLPTARQYGHMKLDAEKATRSILRDVGQLVILRPPAVYGEGMSGALATLVALIKKGVPLPFGWANEKRDYISKNNFADLLVQLITLPASEWRAAGGSVYEPSDGMAVSTDQLIRMLADVLGMQPRLLPVPVKFLRLAGKILRKGDLVSGAIDPLELTGNDQIAADFGWVPREQMPESFNSWLK